MGRELPNIEAFSSIKYTIIALLLKNKSVRTKYGSLKKQDAR